ncbi:MAG: heavy-metal-associated domain-containing protein [Acidobacteria bacterium]|nr:MAG: heavy-metal-associated domain-containing protein [Acidobacteriota bacterium]
MALNLKFNVTGAEKIHCESCEERIGRALKRLPGVEDVQASAKEQRVSVSIDPKRTNAEQVQARLQQIGYEVKLGDAA